MVLIIERPGPADWRGGEIAGSPDWQVTLGERDRAELVATVAAVVAAGVGPAEITVADFPLPGVGPVLARMADDVLDGRGFALLRGVPTDGLDAREREILAVVIGCHLGRVVPQGPAAAPLLHVRDVGVDPAAPTSRSYQHRGQLGFHCDPTDMVALLCLRPARSGGLSLVVSAVAVHNELVRAHPDLAEALYQPWWRDRRTGDGPDSFFAHPVYSVDEQGRLIADYGADYIRSAQRGSAVPRLTERQRAAMAALERLNNDPRLVLTMDLRPGDLQLLNNRVTMHSRTAYQDDPTHRRDLVRIWLDRAQL